jgi:hypothetical protein
MSPLPIDWLDELTNIDMSKRLRFAASLKGAGEFALAEVVFPDTPDLDEAAVARRESQPAQEAA